MIPADAGSKHVVAGMFRRPLKRKSDIIMNTGMKEYHDSG